MVARRASVLFAIAGALSLSACSYECGIVRRTIASGTTNDAAGVTVATVQVSVTEYLRPSFLRLSVGVAGSSGSGAPLRGHVTRARLVTEAGELLAEIPTDLSTLPADGVVALNLDLPSKSEYSRVRSALLTAGAKVVLDTDLTRREHLETTLPDAHDVPGQTQTCRPA